MSEEQQTAETEKESGESEQNEEAEEEPGESEQNEEAEKKSRATEREEARQRRVSTIARAVDITLWVDSLFPPGWLPYGVWSLEQQRYARAFACLVGLIALTVLSLSMSYRTTLRYYRGDFQHGGRRRDSAGDATRRSIVEWRAPWISEHASAVAFASLRAMSRAMEVRLLMLSPIILVVVYAGVGRKLLTALPQGGAAITAIVGVFFTMLGIFQISQNTFGFDRQGYRAWMLAPLAAADLLLGKNVVMWLIGGAIGLAAVGVSVVMSPPPPLDIVAVLFQLMSILMVITLLGNVSSTVAPFQVKSAGFESASPGVMTVVLQALMILATPALSVPFAAPSLVRVFAPQLGFWAGLINLGVSAAMFGGCVLIYRWLLPLQAEVLDARRLKILDAVTPTVER